MRVHGIQWEGCITGDSKVGNCQGAQLFDRVSLRWRLGKLAQALGYKQDKVDEYSISISLDFKVAE
jgi:hypothetical protein